MMNVIEIRQSRYRLTLRAMSHGGFNYRDLSKLLGSATTISTKRDKDTSWDEFYREVERVSASLSDEEIILEHIQFVEMLRDEHGITFDEWVEYMLYAFEKEGKYIPFDSVPEIIKCAKRILAGTNHEVSLYDIYSCDMRKK